MKIVAWLFIVGGICAIVETIFNFWHGRFFINGYIWGIFIGRGLLRLSSGWMTFALICTWLGLVLTPLLWVFAFRTRATPIPQFWGITVGTSRETFFLWSILGFILCAWQAWVLGKADVRRLFTRQGSTAESATDESFSDAR